MATALPPLIETADLDWSPADEPISQRFGDVYFSREDGLAETRHVFLEGNALPARFAQRPSTADHFVVAETGFGTGLNFLATARLWLDLAPDSSGVLHFVSFERYPLSKPDMRRALARWPQLADLAEALLSQYPAPVRGVHRLILAKGRVRLTLFWGDVMDGLETLSFRADAWFLDGFAPARNAEIWQERVLEAVTSHSRPGTTIATFTAVGAIRRFLQAHGFEMKKSAGFGRKRDMLKGIMQHPDSCITPGSEEADRPPTRVLVVGAGMAGSLVARALATRGVPVTVLEQGPRPGQGASGNSQGALYAKLGVEFNAQTALALAGLLHSQRFFSQCRDDSDQPSFWYQTGVLQLAWNEKEQARQNKFLRSNTYPAAIVSGVSAEQASELAGLSLSMPGLWFPHSGWVNPPGLCRYMLDHPAIDTIFDCEVTSLAEAGGNGWRLSDNKGRQWDASTVILCSGERLNQLVEQAASPLPIKPIRGQVTTLPSRLATAPRSVICADGYLNPSFSGQVLLGATFDLHSDDPQVRQESHRENLDRLSRWCPDAIRPGSVSPEMCNGRVGFRATLPDYQPLAGPLARDVSGLFVLAGLGSKGLATGPLLAEYLADLICNQPLCLENSLARRVAPSRFAERRSRAGPVSSDKRT